MLTQLVILNTEATGMGWSSLNFFLSMLCHFYRAQAQLDEKQRELDEVQAKFDAAMREKQELLDDAESCRRKMTAATQLIEGLEI